MDTSNGRPTQGANGAVDWRAPTQRERIVNKIIDTLRRHLPFSRYERLQELKKIAERVEDEIYTAATSQSEYSRKICFMMLTMETRLQNLLSNSATVSVNPSVPSDFTAQTANPNGGDWQEEVYQKINTMKDLYLLDLRFNHGARGAVGDPPLESGDWRAQLQADSRQRIVKKILDTLKRHLPYSGHEGLQAIKKTAVRFEERTYTAATSESDYLRNISLKMLTLENRSQNPMSDPMQSNSTTNNLSNLDLRLNHGARGVVSDPTLESGDWRAQLQADSRQRIVNRILDTLKWHLPYSGHEGLQALKKTAVRFEEKTYTAATSESDYLRNISLKMLTLETRSPNPMSEPIQTNSTTTNLSNPDLRLNHGASGVVGDPTLESGDWRAQLQANTRQRIVNKILDTLKRHLPFSGDEGLHELRKIAARFEENTYTAATSQSNYLREISMKMLTMETRSQNSATSSVNPQI